MEKLEGVSTPLHTVCLAVVLMSIASWVSAAESPKDALQAAAELYEDGDIDGAIEEAE